MKKNNTKILNRCKEKVTKRLERKQYPDQPRPIHTACNIQYEMAERVRAIECGGIGAFHLLADHSGLIKSIDNTVHVLKQHKPYHESDHVLNIAYNTLTGGTCLDDIELHRNDVTYMDALGAERIPDPTTAGDFTRRFSEKDINTLMEAINEVRPRLWSKGLKKEERREAVIDLDGTHAPTWGECKEGMGLSYDGKWCYHPLLVSLANTMEPLYLVNRLGNCASHSGAPQWIDRAVSLVRESFQTVCLRGDTDFSLTANFDRWNEDGVHFAFGIDAMPNLVTIAEELDSGHWKELRRNKKHPACRSRRRRPKNVKKRIVIEKEYRNLTLQREAVAEFWYRPTKCKHSYRVVVLRKSISVEQGQRRLWDEVRYFFYITNITDMSSPGVVRFCNERCNQENLIEQLKNGVHALRMPVGDLESNWAYMVMASIAWSLKAWFALQVRDSEKRDELLAMEFRRFLNGLVRIPVQIITGGRQIIYRILGYNPWIETFLSSFEGIRQMKIAQ